jgi:hypothetical protein
LKYVGISFRTWWEWGGNKTCFKEIEVSIVFININQGQKTLNGKWYSLLNSELESRAKIIETTTKSLPPSSHKQCSTDDTKVYCQVKFFFQHWMGGRGEEITEIERNIKSLIIFARYCLYLYFEWNVICSCWFNLLLQGRRWLGFLAWWTFCYIIFFLSGFITEYYNWVLHVKRI